MKQITNDREIDGATARLLRERDSESQRKFWGSLGVSQPTGSQYEQGQRDIPRAVQSLIFIKYEAGLKQDTGTIEGAQDLRDIAAKATN